MAGAEKSSGESGESGSGDEGMDPGGSDFPGTAALLKRTAGMCIGRGLWMTSSLSIKDDTLGICSSVCDIIRGRGGGGDEER